MKWCVIFRKDIQMYLGQEYEKPYSYSEYTSGGDCYNTVFSHLSNFLDEENMKLSIFESKKNAKEWIKKSGYNYKFEIKTLGELT